MAFLFKTLQWFPIAFRTKCKLFKLPRKPVEPGPPSCAGPQPHGPSPLLPSRALLSTPSSGKPVTTTSSTRTRCGPLAHAHTALQTASKDSTPSFGSPLDSQPLMEYRCNLWEYFCSEQMDVHKWSQRYLWRSLSPRSF